MLDPASGFPWSGETMARAVSDPFIIINLLILFCFFIFFQFVIFSSQSVSHSLCWQSHGFQRAGSNEDEGAGG